MAGIINSMSLSHRRLYFFVILNRISLVGQMGSAGGRTEEDTWHPPAAALRYQ